METEKSKNQPEIVENIESVPEASKAQFTVGKNQVEMEFQAFQRKKDFRRKASKIAFGSLFFLLLIGTVLVVYFRIRKSQQATLAQSQMQLEIPQNQDHVFVNDVSGVLADSENVAKVVVDDSSGLAGKSENYRIKDISIGGGNIVLAAGTENLSLKVSDVHSETLLSKDGKKTQLLLSWKTNKLAKADVKYSKDGKGSERSIKEDGYGFSHALILNSLEQATRYLFTVSASDRSGNVVDSDALAVYTGAKPVSVFELIASQFGDIFGWAMKK